MSDEKIGYRPEGFELDINPPKPEGPDLTRAVGSNDLSQLDQTQDPEQDTSRNSDKNQQGKQESIPESGLINEALLKSLFDILSEIRNNPNFKNISYKFINHLADQLAAKGMAGLRKDLYLNLINSGPHGRIEPLQNLPPRKSSYWLKELDKEAQEGEPSTPANSEDQPPTAEPTTPEETATDAKKSVEQSDRLAEIKNDLKQVLEDLSNQKKEPEDSNPSPNQSTLP